MTEYNEYYDKVDALNCHNRDLLSDYIEENNPQWLDDLQSISCFLTLASVSHSGCASGAYMPAVIYYRARQALLGESGDDMIEYAMTFLDEIGDEGQGLAEAAKRGVNNMAAYIASLAVEAWVYNMEQDVLAKVDELLEDQAENHRYNVIATVWSNMANEANSPDNSHTSHTVQFSFDYDDDLSEISDIFMIELARTADTDKDWQIIEANIAYESISGGSFFIPYEFELNDLKSLINDELEIIQAREYI